MTRRQVSLALLAIVSSVAFGSRIGIAASVVEPTQCPRGFKATTGGCIGIQIPPNAELTYLGNDWTCKRGFRRVGDDCVGVQVPPNAELTYLGNDWTCKRGFRRSDDGCVAVQVPSNAELTYLGSDWTCKRGFRRAGDSCLAVQVPANAELTHLGNDWTCRRGFRRASDGCVAVEVPPNAELSYLGNDWTCKVGFKKEAGNCVPMTHAELQRYLMLLAEAQKVARASGSSPGEPEGERAEVVLRIRGCDYFVADGPGGHYLLEWYAGYDPAKGDRLVGPIASYGFKDVHYPGHGSGRVYVDDYLLSKSRAQEKLLKKCE